MWRSLFLLLIGATAGAVVSYHFAVDRAEPGAPGQRAGQTGTAGDTGVTDLLAIREQLQIDESPQEALAAIDAMPNDWVRNQAQAEVLRDWARDDPRAMLDYAAGLDQPSRQRILSGAVGALAQTDPFAALDLLDEVPPQMRAPLQQMAVTRAAEQDPERALAYVEGLPLSGRRQQLIQGVASGYGRHDPDAALAWADSLQPAQPGAFAAVLGGIAQVDPERAFDIALTSTSPIAPSVFQSIAMGAVGEAGQVERIAERLVAMPGSTGRAPLQALIGNWASRDPGRALEWLLANDSTGDLNTLRMAAAQLSSRDPAAAAAYVDRVPREFRAEWLAQVAQGYARLDSQQALGWIGQYRGDPAYDGAAAQLVQQLAQYDVDAARGLLDTISDPQAGDRAAATVAFAWAQSDPAGAAAWASSRSSAQIRQTAATAVAQQWFTQDPDSARAWVLALPAGAERDGPLRALVASTAIMETPDAQLLGAFSNDQTRQQALVAAVRALGQRDPAAARAMIDSYVTDPALRRQAEQWLEAGQPSFGASFGVGQRIVSGSDGVPVFLGPVFEPD